MNGDAFGSRKGFKNSTEFLRKPPPFIVFLGTRPSIIEGFHPTCHITLTTELKFIQYTSTRTFQPTCIFSDFNSLFNSLMTSPIHGHNTNNNDNSTSNHATPSRANIKRKLISTTRLVDITCRKLISTTRSISWWECNMRTTHAYIQAFNCTYDKGPLNTHQAVPLQPHDIYAIYALTAARRSSMEHSVQPRPHRIGLRIHRHHHRRHR